MRILFSLLFVLFTLVPSSAFAEGEPGLRYVENQLVFRDSTGTQADALGVDTSFYNGDVDWAELKKIGIDFAIVRVGGRGWGNGSLYVDEWFRNALFGSLDAGLNTGVYFYSMAANRAEAVREAEYVLTLLNGLTLQLPVYIDMEFSGDYPNGRTDRLTTTQRVDFALAFCKTIENAGYDAGVYANESFFRDELNYQALSDYSFWVASYTNNSEQPDFTGYDLWQFSDRCRIPGVSGSCDMNAVFLPAA